jgi:aspartyl-tRNA(Asn)/glutamyl-tRNA(Gln) amidotransferase subunit A
VSAPPPSARLADLAAAIERAAGDLSIGEEPARFVAALEAGAPARSPAAPARAPGSTGPPPPGTLAALAAAMRGREASPIGVTEACLARITRLDPELRAFVRVDGPGARALARAREGDLHAGRPAGPLAGVPVGYKDLFAVRGHPAACGTAIGEYFLAGGDATAVARLGAAGVVVIGKLNMTELALGPFGDNAHHGDVQNPWRPGHVAGGSSSGSGAAVAAGLAWATLGTDTGGSIRLPAAACGIVGLKPTYGRISRAGVMPLSWSLDHVGPMARTVHDTALLLGILAGPDADDATTSGRAVPDYVGALDRPVAGLRAGVPDRYFWDDLDPEVARFVRKAMADLAELGVEVREVPIPDPRPLVDVANVLARSESAALHVRLVRETPHLLQPAVRARLEVGLHVGALDYLQAARLRARLTRAFVDEAFAEVDVLLTPTIPEPAPRLADAKAGPADEVVGRMNRFSRLTRPFNALGLPALSVPCGLSALGLPVALQIVGRPFDEATVFRVGHAYERAAGWWRRLPVGEA